MPANLNMATAFIQLSLKGGAAVIAGMNNMRKSIASSLAPLSDNFKQLEASALGFVSAASPQAIRTLQGSATLLSATIGTALVPQIIAASKWIQQLANYIREMNPETKQSIANWVGYAAAVMGAVYVFTKLNSIFSMIVANPVAATFLAISAAILKVTADTDRMISKMNETVEVMDRMKKGKYTEKEYKSSAAAAIEGGGGTPEEQLKKAQAVRDRLAADVKAKSNHYANRDVLYTLRDRAKGAMGQRNQLEEDQYSVEQKLKEAGMLDDLIGRLQNKKGGPKFTAKEDLQKGGSGVTLAGAGVGGSGGGGGATSLENAFMQSAQASLAADDIQQKILQAQLEGNVATQKTAQAMERVADATERQQHP